MFFMQHTHWYAYVHRSQCDLFSLTAFNTNYLPSYTFIDIVGANPIDVRNNKNCFILITKL